MRMKRLGIFAGIVLTFVLAGVASADITMYDEDFGDRVTYPDGTPAMTTGPISGQYSWDYDTYAYPTLGTLFAQQWSESESPVGYGEISSVSGNRVLMVWATGGDEDWGKVVQSSFMNMFRPLYDLPMVMELRIKPAYYNPYSVDILGDPVDPDKGCEDPSMEFREMASKFRFGWDTGTYNGDSRVLFKYHLYYDGTLLQMFRGQGFSGANAGPTVDIGGKDGGGYNIWNPDENGVGEWLEYRFWYDVANQQVKIYMTDEDHPLHHPFLSGTTDLDASYKITEFTLTTADLDAGETFDYARFRQIGDLQGGCDQTTLYIPDTEEPIGDVKQYFYQDDDPPAGLDGSICQYDNFKVYYVGTPTRTRRISGQFTVAYPYWCYFKLDNITWQLRKPGTTGSFARAIQQWGREEFQLWNNPPTMEHASYSGTEEPNIDIVRAFTIGLVSPGTYDFSMKRPNRLAGTALSLVIPSTADVTGVQITLKAGDASGDFYNYFIGPGFLNPVNRSDNDCDSWDLNNVTTEFNGTGYPYLVTSYPPAVVFRGQSGDFDNDVKVTTWDKQAAINNQGQKGGTWRYSANIAGKASIKYPGWLYSIIGEVYYQVRNPGMPPTTPVYSGDTIDEPEFLAYLKLANPGTISFGLAIPGIKGGTYDLALKHHNHIADVVQMVVPSTSGVVTGLWLSALWAGDADGDNNQSTVYPTDKKGDNDVDLKDRYTLTYQNNGSKPTTRGYNADFNSDGTVNLLDYNGLKYGYTNRPNPGNWWK